MNRLTSSLAALSDTWPHQLLPALRPDEQR